MRIRDARGLARHEASHAVVARRLGLRVPVVSLKAQPGLAGWCAVTAVNLSVRQRSVLLLTLAGPWAEARHLGLHGGTLPPGSDSDWAAARRLSHELYRDRWQWGLDAGFRAVARLLDDSIVQAEVAAVARQLLVRPVLTGAELDDVCRSI
jgi:hypothetical protein